LNLDQERRGRSEEEEEEVTRMSLKYVTRKLEDQSLEEEHMSQDSQVTTRSSTIRSPRAFTLHRRHV
jgi:hypothetical protein